jgi:hypothetical protein
VAQPPDLLTLPFDQFQRYTAVAQVADAVRAALGKQRLRVLDVGGFAMTPIGDAMLPLAHFLPSDLAIVTDLVDSALPNYVRSSGARLPFHSEAFDLVVTCDTLEHVPPPDRPAFVDELLRVAHQCVVLMAPFYSETTKRAERVLRDYLAASDRTHRQLEEHFEQGLPALADLRALLADRGVTAIEFADGYLPNWLAMIMIHLTPGTSLDFLAELDRFYNRHFSPDDRREPAYRRAFVIAKQGREGLLAAIGPAFDSSPAANFPQPDFAADLASLQRQAHSDGHARFDSLETENARLRGVIEGYEQGRFMRFMRWLHDVRNRLLRSTDGR